MRRAVLLVCLAPLVLGGCQALLGIDDPVPGDDDAATDGAGPDGLPHYSITVTKLGGATGEGGVTADAIGLDCDVGCSTKTIDLPGPQTIVLDTAPNAGSWFQAWGGRCSGTERTCMITVDGDVEITAQFTGITQNLAFVTSQTFTGSMGGVAGADQKCIDAASAAGLSGIFAALVSEEQGDSSRDHVLLAAPGGVGGWLRLDGLPFADGIQSLVNDHRIFYPLIYDEYGHVIAPGDDPVWTGSTESLTSAAEDCMFWTSTGFMGYQGEATSGPGRWQNAALPACTGAARLYCMMVNHSTTVDPPPPVTGKAIFVSNGELTFTAAGSLAAANAACETSKPAGAGAVVALVARANAAAATSIDPAATYVRPDHAVVGTGAELIAASRGEGVLRTGIWQSGNGLYLADATRVFTGAIAGIDGFGDTVSTCADWTNGTTNAAAGSPQRTGVAFWKLGANVACNAVAMRVYCVEL